MPTNILRAGSRKPPRPAPRERAPAGRIVRIRAGRVTVRARLLETPTADRLWDALPIFSTAETWGQSIHFETPVETGRDRTARLNGSIGDLYFWSDDDRVIIAFGPTPISGPDEIRLPRPCNLWAQALDDVGQLRIVTPGEKVAMERQPPA
jgi:hypothetical protein